MSYELSDVKSSRYGCDHPKRFRINFQLGFDETFRTQCGCCGTDITEMVARETSGSMADSDYAWTSEGRIDEI